MLFIKAKGDLFMLKEILNDATSQDLKNFVADLMSELKIAMPQVYENLLIELHKNVYGSHFSKALVIKACGELEDLNGNKGAKWSLDETNQILANYNLKYNEFDFYYVLNMIHSDYSNYGNTSIDFYVKLACMFLDDKDAPKGKALKYYLAMRKDL